MLLPQSSAFAALKNRLNSVSAIGFLQVAPRPYVSSSPFPYASVVSSRAGSISAAISSLHERQRSLGEIPAHALSPSAPPAATSSSYDRTNRLKGRDDGIRWTELLDKFRTVQEHFRRHQRGGNPDHDDGYGWADARSAETADSKTFTDVVRIPVPTAPAPSVQAPSVEGGKGPPTQTKPKTGLAGKFSRLGSGPSGGNRLKKAPNG
jgi:vacuole morphology and inheritance protein 14